MSILTNPEDMTLTSLSDLDDYLDSSMEPVWEPVIGDVIRTADRSSGQIPMPPRITIVPDPSPSPTNNNTIRPMRAFRSPDLSGVIEGHTHRRRSVSRTPIEPREIREDRKYFLDFIYEKRSWKSTYRKFLMINISPTELMNIHKDRDLTLIRKNVPKWIFDDVNRGETVQAVLFLRPGHMLFKLNKCSNTILNLRQLRNTHRVDRQYTTRMNGLICGIINIKRHIISDIDSNGRYDENIKDISEMTNKDLDSIERMGKMKPIHALEMDNFRLFESPLTPGIFMTKFSVETVVKETGEVIENGIIPDDVGIMNTLYHNLINIKHVPYDGFSNMGTVWC